MLEFTGKIVKILPVKTFSSGFTKRTIVIKENKESKYENIVPFVLKKDKCALGDHLAEDALVKVHFVIDGHPYDKDGTGQNVAYYCDLVALKFDILENGKPSISNIPMPEIAVPSDSLVDSVVDTDEDVPF